MDRNNVSASLGKTLTSPRKRILLPQSLKKSNSVISTSGRSNQSVQIICKTACHTVESFGPPLPVLVTEALTFIDRNATVSVSVSLDGWAWLVCGRRLLVWQCKTAIHDPKQRRTFNSQCRELLLPQSDLAHRADCIAVWLIPGHQVPSCMAVSPEGVVRYWSSIAHEGSSVETSAELAGQEVDCLTYVPGHGCILATTTCTVALLQPQFISGRNSVSCRVLRTSKGWLGGIGRRMSSLIFGAMPQSPVTETKLVKVNCTLLNEKASRVLILAGSSLQYWSFPNGETEKMEFDEDIGHTISQTFQRRFWESNACMPQSMDTWLIDMQPCEDGIVVLMAASCTELSPEVHFAIGLIPLAGTKLTNSLQWFMPLKIGPIRYHDNIESTILSYRFILSGWEAIVYNQQTVLVANSMSEHDQEKIDLVRGGEDNILGGALCSGTPVLFTRNLGLVTIIPTDFNAQDFSTYSENNISLDYGGSSFAFGGDNFASHARDDDLREMTFSSDGVSQLSAAFLFSLKQNKAQCQEILSELFPLQEEPVMDIDATLDTLVLTVAKNLIDDYPANDPRWTDHRDLSMTINAVTSMQIPHQLEGKQKALDLFVSFLKEFNLWNRFCAVSYRGIIMATTHVLGEYAEKIVAAIAIYNLQNRHGDIMDPIMDQTLSSKAHISDELTTRDIFYREVSNVHVFLLLLVNSANEVTQSERVTHQVSQNILQVNSLLLSVLHEVVKYRQHNAERFVPVRCSSGITEYLPWTATTGKQGLRDCLQLLMVYQKVISALVPSRIALIFFAYAFLIQQQNIILKYGVNGTNDGLVRNELYEQLVSLIDLILDGKKCHLESIRGTEKFEVLLKQYETERTNLIQPLIKQEQYEQAAVLAEKYCDFASLILICELTNNQNRLDSYIERFAAQDFVGFLFSWYIKDGKQGKLVDRCRRGGAAELAEKLSEHPSLSWVQAALSDDLRLASNTIHTLAVEETELVTRKKSMLSLSKLALFASDGLEEEVEECVRRINKELELIAHQEELPASVLSSYGYDIDKLRVLTPTELITLYTCDENLLASEYDFKKALDLLDFVDEQEDKTSLSLRIWARAARRDRWDTVGNNPEQQSQSTIFFKLVDLSHFMGAKIEDFLPPLDAVLTEPELGSLAGSSSFQFLIKIGYEYVYRNYQVNNE